MRVHNGWKNDDAALFERVGLPTLCDVDVVAARLLYTDGEAHRGRLSGQRSAPFVRRDLRAGGLLPERQEVGVGSGNESVRRPLAAHMR